MMQRLRPRLIQPRRGFQERSGGGHGKRGGRGSGGGQGGGPCRARVEEGTLIQLFPCDAHTGEAEAFRQVGASRIERC